MSFFKKFPKVSLDINRDGVLDASVDLWRYVDIIDEFADDSFAYKRIRIQNGVRPDQLSHELYGTPDFYWTFFILNDELKNGLEVWPKSDNEMQTYIDDSYGDYAVFVFPPVDDPLDPGEFSIIDGMPLNDPKYKDQLYLLYDKDGLNESYLAAKIVYWDHNRYQLWVDKTQLYNYTPVAGGPSDGPDAITKVDDTDYNEFFTIDGDYKAFHVRYLDNPQKIKYSYESDSDQYYEDSDDSETLAVNQDLWLSDLSADGFSTSEADNLVYCYQIYENSQKAPRTYSGTIGYLANDLEEIDVLASLSGAYRVITVPNSISGAYYYLFATVSLPFVDGGTQISHIDENDNEVNFVEGDGGTLTLKRVHAGEPWGFYQVRFSRTEYREINSAYDILSLDPGGSAQPTFESYEDYHTRKNDEARDIRIIRPDRVREFSKEYFSRLTR